MLQPKFSEISVFEIFCFFAALKLWVNGDPVSATRGLKDDYKFRSFLSLTFVNFPNFLEFLSFSFL